MARYSEEGHAWLREHAKEYLLEGYHSVANALPLVDNEDESRLEPLGGMHTRGVGAYLLLDPVGCVYILRGIGASIAHEQVERVFWLTGRDDPTGYYVLFDAFWYEEPGQAKYKIGYSLHQRVS
jgi:hypothetical protein